MFCPAPPALSLFLAGGCRSPYVWRTWVLLKWSIGDHRAAYELAQRGLKHDPDNLDMLYYASSCLQAMGYFGKAVQSVARSLSLMFLCHTVTAQHSVTRCAEFLCRQTCFE